MPGGMRVFAGVTVRRGIAAEGDAAFLTGAKMHPGRADLDALDAFLLFSAVAH